MDYWHLRLPGDVVAAAHGRSTTEIDLPVDDLSLATGASLGAWIDAMLLAAVRASGRAPRWTSPSRSPDARAAVTRDGVVPSVLDPDEGRRHGT